MSNAVCLGVEFIVILRLVDPHAPQNDRRMVTVLQYHFFGMFAGNLLPGFIAYMLPARDLGKYQQAQFITGIDEGLCLRIMGSPHRIAA